MPRKFISPAAVLAVLLCSEALNAQTTRQPYQFVTASIGYGAIRPSGETGLPGSTVDGAAGLQLGFAMHVRQAEDIFAYGRFGSDVSEVRQHLAITLGVEVRPLHFGRWHPYAGAGFGLLWLEPVARAGRQLDRRFAPAGEALAGVDWEAVPRIRIFAEYRLTAARFAAVSERAGECTTGICDPYILSGTNVLHLGHTGWLGLRIQLF